MAHNLNIINGKTSFFSVKERPWHGLGTILDNPATSEEAINYAGLNYQVDKVPNYAFMGTDFIKTPGSYSTYRMDTNDILGDKVGSKYEVVQNTDAFSFFDAIVGEGEAIYETAGALGKGETVFIAAKLPDYIRVSNTDDIEKYLLLTMSHDGSGAIQTMFTPIRVVCNNTLNAALSGAKFKVSIKHTKSAHKNLEEAHKIMGITNKLSDELSDIFNIMTKIKVGDNQLKDYLEKVFLPIDLYNRRKNGISLKDDEISTRMSNKIDDVYSYAFNGPGQDLNTCRGTAFGAYNAVTGYFQNVKDFTTPTAKIKTNVLGGNYNTMQRAMDLALDLQNS